MRARKNRVSQTRSYSCRKAKTGIQMGQEIVPRGSSLQPVHVVPTGETQRCQCRGLSPGRRRRRLRESTGVTLLSLDGTSVDTLRRIMLEVGWPRILHQHPHQAGCRQCKASVIEEAYRYESEYYRGRGAPEPDILMKNVKSGYQ